MKVVHIESGLGNQMLSYCEYLAIKKMNPEEDCYIEKIVYGIPEASEYINQWNGYELDNIFGINAPDIMSTLSEDQRKTILDEIIQTQFWCHEWNWPVYFQSAFKKAGINLINVRGDFEANKAEWSISRKGKPPLSYRLKQTGWYSNLKRVLKKGKRQPEIEKLFYKNSQNELIGQRLSFKYLGNGIERIDTEIREAFSFPTITDSENTGFLNQICSCESVAIHARRGDMLTVNGQYYKSGYFKRAVMYIKRNVNAPVFFFFCDPGSVDWCRSNPGIFGLDFEKDKICFVDCNGGSNSYRDMQLMSLCKHNIITNSSFGWWGAYLNQNPDKITISPEISINTTHHM